MSVDWSASRTIEGLPLSRFDRAPCGDPLFTSFDAYQIFSAARSRGGAADYVMAWPAEPWRRRPHDVGRPHRRNEAVLICHRGERDDHLQFTERVSRRLRDRACAGGGGAANTAECWQHNRSTRLARPRMKCQLNSKTALDTHQETMRLNYQHLGRGLPTQQCP